MKITGKHELEMPVSVEFEIASAPQPEGIEGLEQIEPKKLQLQIIVNCIKLKKLARTIRKDTKLLLRTLYKMKRHGWLVIDQTDCSQKQKPERRGRWIDPEKLPQLFREGTDENGDALVSLSEVRKALRLATVEEPVRRAEWKQDFDGESYCSACGAYSNKEKKECPVCGAKMDGEEERKQ